MEEDLSIAKALKYRFGSVSILTENSIPETIAKQLGSFHVIESWEVRKKTIWVDAIKRLWRYYVEASQGRAQFYKRPSIKAKKDLSRYLSAISLLEAMQPSFILSTFVNQSRPLIVAANVLGIPSIAVQHGPYYDNLKYWTRPYEWPARHIVVWNRDVLDLCRKQFNGDVNFFSMDGPIWKLKNLRKRKNDDRLFIYESRSCKAFKLLSEAITEVVGKHAVALKPHPHLLLKKTSMAYTYTGSTIFDPVHSISPSLGVSLGSSVSDELIASGVPCITILPEQDSGNQAFPFSGRFILNEFNNVQVAEEISRIYQSPSLRNELLTEQIRERKHLYTSENANLKKLTDYVEYLVSRQAAIA